MASGDALTLLLPAAATRLAEGLPCCIIAIAETDLDAQDNPLSKVLWYLHRFTHSTVMKVYDGASAWL
jgi:hypothetical protein